MEVERLKYVIWAVEMQRAVDFYVKVFGGKIWWNDLRPIHALLYFLFQIPFTY